MATGNLFESVLLKIVHPSSNFDVLSVDLTYSLNFPEMEKDYSHYPDTELWQDFKDGNKDAYSFIYSRYVPILYNYGYKIAQNQILVEDCIQDVFEHLLRSRQHLSNTDSIKYYLFKSLRREIIGKLNRQHRLHTTQEALPDYQFQVVFSYESDLVEEETSKARQHYLIQALNELPARQKEAIFLRFYDNLSYEQIASIMGIDTHSVYKTIYKAIGSLQKKLPYELSMALLITQLPLYFANQA